MQNETFFFFFSNIATIQQYPWLHATPDFLCSCDCCGEGCGEVKCPLCIENCDFDSYVQKSSSCLIKENNDQFCIKTDHQYYYQVQQQLFTTKKKYNDFIVYAFDSNGEEKFVLQRIVPDQDHWDHVEQKLTKFWRLCVLPEMLGKWYTRRHNVSDVKPAVNETNSICYCRQGSDDKTVRCCNGNCRIKNFHVSCLGVDSIPKTWYCPNCRLLPEFKRSGKKAKQTVTVKETMKPKIVKKGLSVAQMMAQETICQCDAKPKFSDKVLECHNPDCDNGIFFHLQCMGYSRMPNNGKTTWKCPKCKNTKPRKVQNNKPIQQNSDISFVKETNTPSSKHAPLGNLGQREFDTIISPKGWLDCTIIHAAHILLQQINPAISGFVQILHTGNNHWVCVSSVGCPSGYVYLYDSLSSQVVAQDIIDQVSDL